MRKKLSKSADAPNTIQRTYRFNAKLFNAFEDDCAMHLANAKRVIEAAMLHWMDTDYEARKMLARNHGEKIGRASREE